MSRTIRCLTLAMSLALALTATPALGQDAEPTCDPAVDPASSPAAAGTADCPPSATNDPELEAMFPTAITGAERIRVETNLFAVILAQAEEDDPEQAAAAAEQLAGVVGQVGRTLDDVSVGQASFNIGEGAEALVSRIDAFRVRGAEAAAFLDAYLGLQGGADLERTPLRIADRDVIHLAYGTDGDRTMYVHTLGDVIWMIYQVTGAPLPEESLAEIVSQLG